MILLTFKIAQMWKQFLKLMQRRHSKNHIRNQSVCTSFCLHSYTFWTLLLAFYNNMVRKDLWTYFVSLKLTRSVYISSFRLMRKLHFKTERKCEFYAQANSQCEKIGYWIILTFYKLMILKLSVSKSQLSYIAYNIAWYTCWWLCLPNCT